MLANIANTTFVLVRDVLISL